MAQARRRVTASETSPIPARLPSDGSRRRGRRSAREVESLILDAARDLFASQGYASTSTREIARRAGVHEPMLYRRFGTKAGLFRAAVLVPFNDVISSYLATWQAQAEEPASLRDLVRAFIEPLYALMREHRVLALALIRAQVVDADILDEDGTPDVSEFRGLLDRLVPQLEVERARRSLRVDPATTNIVCLGMVLGVALLDPILAAGTVATSPARVSQEMIDLIIYGVLPAVSKPGTLPNDDPQLSAHLILELHDRVVAAERRAARAEAELARRCPR